MIGAAHAAQTVTPGGGVGYQLLAVVLTYLSIAGNYVPDIVRALREDSDISGSPLALVIITAVTAVAAPFFGGIKNIIGLLIIGFALYQAWVINRPSRLAFNGPYRLAPAAGAPATASYGYGTPPPPPPPLGRV